MTPSRVVVLGLILSLQNVQIQGEKTPSHVNTKNGLNDFTAQLKDTLQSIKSNNEGEIIDDKSEYFDDINEDTEPLISDVDFDNLNNALIVKFNKNFVNYHDPLEDSSYNNNDDKLIEQNLLRDTRGGSNNLMRFGKRQLENSKDQRAMDSTKSSSRYGRSSSTSRDSRGDNFMRFGRSNNNNLMRFGRSASNSMMRFGRSNNNLMRFGRSNSNLMRFGRSNSNLMRFGRSNSNLMRFGRNDPSRSDSFIRFGRNSNNLMRFGRNDPGRLDGFIRFGRNTNNLMRFGRNDRNFMRFGKLDQNFMRFGKRDEIFSGSHLDSDLNNKNNNKTNDNDNIENNIGAGFYNLNDEPDDITDILLDE